MEGIAYKVSGIAIIASPLCNKLPLHTGRASITRRVSLQRFTVCTSDYCLLL